MIKKKKLIGILKILNKYKFKLVITVLISVIISLLSIFESYLLSYLIDDVLTSNAKLTLITISIIMLLIVVINLSLTGIKSLVIQKISFSMDCELMQEFYSKVLNLPFSFLEQHKSGELTSRLNDTKKVRYALSYGIISVITNIITFLIVGVALFKINKSMFGISVIFIFLLGIVSFIFGRFYKEYYPKDMELYSNLQAFTTESFNGIETIKTMPASDSFSKEYKKRQSKSFNISWNIDEHCVIQKSFVSLITRTSSVLILISGFYFAMKGSSTLGQVAAFLSLSGFFSSSINSLMDLQAGIQEALAAIERLFEILYTETIDSNGKEIPEKHDTEIMFDKISFAYSGLIPVYENFTLHINHGEWISLVGKTGCGKTTFAKLLLKFYQIDSGNISFNGKDLEKIDTSWLYSKIAYIPQDIVLFSGTILDNITLFNQTVTMEKVIDVTKQVGIYDKIISLEHGFDSIVGENGTSLSGGEKQKIAIARALLKNPLLMIFDEATSNLDIVSEKQIVKIIKDLHKKGLTIITIAHRLSTIHNCDRIVVLEKGNIIEEGTHDDLIKKQGVYSQMII
ncbi:MAG: peptidase domain-containing ABC transporter [Treponema sp.]|nr:peptidase domain-containing ABC transporter [Clostridia bacterium]MCF0241346.1 peptidase domain-containing ABC transporter [Treponema sp.]